MGWATLDVPSWPLRPMAGSVEDGGSKVAVPVLPAVAEATLESVAEAMLLLPVEEPVRLANPEPS